MMQGAAACSCWPRHRCQRRHCDRTQEQAGGRVASRRLAAAAWAGLAVPSCFQTTHLPKQRLWQTLGQAQTRTHWSSSIAAAKAAAQQEGVRRNQGSCHGPDLPCRKHWTRDTASAGLILVLGPQFRGHQPDDAGGIQRPAQGPRRTCIGPVAVTQAYPAGLIHLHGCRRLNWLGHPQILMRTAVGGPTHHSSSPAADKSTARTQISSFRASPAALDENTELERTTGGSSRGRKMPEECVLGWWVGEAVMLPTNHPVRGPRV